MDKITVKNAEKIADIDCQITKDDETGVSYHPASALTKTENKSPDDIISIRFYDTPQGLQNAENEKSSGNYAQAIILFDGVISEIKSSASKYRPFHLQYALYGKAATNIALENYSEAITSFKQLFLETPATRFKKEAYANWLDCGRKIKDIQILQELLANLEKDASSIAKNIGLNVRLAIADFQLNDDPKTALETYRELAVNEDKDIVNKALLGQIICLNKLNEKGQLSSLISTIVVDKDTSPFLLVVVYSSQGDAQFKVAAEKKDVTKYHDALVLYLKAISLGFPTKEIESYYQQALYNAAICCQKLADMISKPSSTDKYKKQAAVLLDLLSGNYKDSELGKKAKEMLKKLQER